MSPPHRAMGKRKSAPLPTESAFTSTALSVPGDSAPPAALSALHGENAFSALRRPRNPKQPPQELPESVPSVNAAPPPPPPTQPRTSFKRKRELSNADAHGDGRPDSSRSKPVRGENKKGLAVGQEGDRESFEAVRVSTFAPLNDNVRWDKSVGEDVCVIGMMAGETLFFRGSVGVAPLLGSVIINGFTASANSALAGALAAGDIDAATDLAFWPCHSPRTGPLMVIECFKDAAPLPLQGSLAGERTATPCPSTPNSTSLARLYSSLLPATSPTPRKFDAVVALTSASWMGLHGIELYASWCHAVKDWRGERDVREVRGRDIDGWTDDAAKDALEGLDGFYPVFTAPRACLAPLCVPAEWHSVLSAVLASSPQPEQELGPDATQPEGGGLAPPVVAVLGPKGSGKSTFARWMVNGMLGRYQEVAFLECDPGQPEFHPAGCVSVTFLKRPLLGPPITHFPLSFQHPSRSIFVGTTTPKSDPDHYTASLTSLHSHYVRHTSTVPYPVPLVINAHGWTKGMGLDMMRHFLDSVGLTAAVEIVTAGSAGDVVPNLANGPRMVTIPSASRGTKPATDPPSLRSERVLAHLHQLHGDPAEPFTLGERTPRWGFEEPLTLKVPLCVPVGAVAARFFLDEVPRSETLDALDGTLVALCVERDQQHTQPRGSDGDGDGGVGVAPRVVEGTRPAHPDLTECVGFGIVRGVDRDSGHYAIVTSTPIDLLARRGVNVLARGKGCDVPVGAYVRGFETARELPYLTSGFDSGIGHAAKRVRHNLKRRKAAGSYTDGGTASGREYGSD